MSERNPRVHRGCGGGVTYVGPAHDGRPRFGCSKCGDTWTHGHDGGPWASLVAPTRPMTIAERERVEQGYTVTLTKEGT